MTTENETFSPLVAAGIVVGGLACFVAFVVVLAFARGPGAHDGGAHALSRSAVGYAGLVALLDATGGKVLVNRGGQLGADAGRGLLVLTPPPGARVPDDVVDQVAADQVLLVLPKWDTAVLDDHPGWVRRTGMLSRAAVLRVLPTGFKAPALQRRTGVATPHLTGSRLVPAIRSGPVQWLQTISGPGLTPVLTDEEGRTVLATDNAGLFVLSDPDLLDNAGLADADAAAGAVTLLRHLAGDETIGFDLSLNDFARSRDPLRAVFEPPLLGATLCAAAAALLLGLAAAVRFGPVQAARRSFEPGKAALADNAAALIARARRERMLAQPYAGLTQRLAARAAGLRRELPPAEAAAALAARRGGGALPGLLEQAAAVRDRAGLVQVAGRLYRWRQEMLHGNR